MKDQDVITYRLNGKKRTFEGDPTTSLLKVLREEEGIFSVKDGCSGQGACGACLLEMNGEPVLSCRTPMSKVADASVVTIEGFDPVLRDLLASTFVEKGAVQCGFCTPGFLSRTRILLENHPNPGRDEIKKALGLNLCRCTGYVKIIDAIEEAAKRIREKHSNISKPFTGIARLGQSYSKIDAYGRAVGRDPFVSDMRIKGMLFGALKFSDYPRAEVLAVDTAEAVEMDGVKAVFTAGDIPGDRITGHLVDDWPLMVAQGETTRYIGDVLAGVVAETEEIARKAAGRIKVSYRVLDPVTDVLAAEESPVRIHGNSNLLGRTEIKRGQEIDAVLRDSEYVVDAVYTTQRVEHAFLETEAALAEPQGEGIRIFVQSQGIYEDQQLLSRILGLPEEKVDVTLIPSGGAFGGKEDLTVQGHAALFAFRLNRPVMVRLDRNESIRMHPKRHPMVMHYTLGCDAGGKLTGLKARIIGDTGAYASLGPSVLERSAGHAAGGYYLPNVDILSKAMYTNNIPCGAMRGFGVNQVTFAMESAIDELCEKGSFDRWRFRYENALQDGLKTTTGQVLKGGVGLREVLTAVKEDFERARYAGIAVGIKNIGFGNGLVDESEVKVEIQSDSHIVLHHGWTEMGQGIDTIAVQLFCDVSGLDRPECVEIRHTTRAAVIGGTTTASRGTYLLGNSIIDVAEKIRQDLRDRSLSDLVGKEYRGYWGCDWTTKPEKTGENLTHVAYSYAAQVVILDEKGNLEKVIAAHDVGKAVNPLLLEGQIEGGVVMGLGYALSEDLPLENGMLVHSKFGKLGIPRIRQLPEIDVRILEIPDPYGPFGVKGIGEIGLVPTAAAVSNALYQFDRTRRYELPLKKGKK